MAVLVSLNLILPSRTACPPYSMFTCQRISGIRHLYQLETVVLEFEVRLCWILQPSWLLLHARSISNTVFYRMPFYIFTNKSSKILVSSGKDNLDRLLPTIMMNSQKAWNSNSIAVIKNNLMLHALDNRQSKVIGRSSNTRR